MKSISLALDPLVIKRQLLLATERGEGGDASG